MDGRAWSLLAALALLTHGCLLDIAPARAPIDEVWVERMLAGQYGQWFHGQKSTYVGRDEILSWPAGASGTRYGIDIVEQSALGGGGWSVVGGLIGRIRRPALSIELYGKHTTRVHGMSRTATDEDHTYEFFLIIRPTPGGRGRLVRHWSFPRNSLRRQPREDIRRYAPFSVEGFVTFDESSRMATVSITGLRREFVARVNLSSELDEPCYPAVPQGYF